MTAPTPKSGEYEIIWPVPEPAAKPRCASVAPTQRLRCELESGHAEAHVNRERGATVAWAEG